MYVHLNIYDGIQLEYGIGAWFNNGMFSRKLNGFDGLKQYTRKCQ